jgi:hypothetical protein
MHLIDVDDVGLETPQGLVNLPDNSLPAGIAEWLAVLPIEADLVATIARLRCCLSASAFPTISSERPNP